LVAPTSVRLVTSNPGKFQEVRALLAPFGISVRWSRARLPELQADTLEEVVRGKLAEVPRSAMPIVVEDSGLFVESLDGFPGVYSAYAFRTIGPRGLIRLVGPGKRRASFQTVAGLRWGRTERLYRGACLGRLSSAPRGTQGFGFDPIFVPEGEHRTFGEMDLPTKFEALGRSVARRRWPLTAGGTAKER
jgi:XTP/dITP diphosphohydrolase